MFTTAALVILKFGSLPLLKNSKRNFRGEEQEILRQGVYFGNRNDSSTDLVFYIIICIYITVNCCESIDAKATWQRDSTLSHCIVVYSQIAFGKSQTRSLKKTSSYVFRVNQFVSCKIYDLA